MKEIILQELKKILNLELNQCYNKITESNNIVKILKSKYNGSSIDEVREMMDIYSKLTNC